MTEHPHTDMLAEASCGQVKPTVTDAYDWLVNFLGFSVLNLSTILMVSQKALRVADLATQKNIFLRIFLV